MAIDGFPLDYAPVRYPFFGISSQPSGVGANLALALRALGSEVAMLAQIGADPSGQAARAALEAAGIDTRGVLTSLDRTPQSVILHDPSGRRQCLTDLKDLQDHPYPLDRFRELASGADWALLTNLNPNRALLPEARRLGLRVATDVHAIADLDDPYNQDFMRAADVLFLSHERLPDPPEACLRAVRERYGTPVIGLGMGSNGALLSVHGEPPWHVPAVTTRRVVNTAGAGDALFAAFMHGYARRGHAREALERAVIFASYKIGESGGAVGFLDEQALDRLHRERHP